MGHPAVVDVHPDKRSPRQTFTSTNSLSRGDAAYNGMACFYRWDMGYRYSDGGAKTSERGGDSPGYEWSGNKLTEVRE